MKKISIIQKLTLNKEMVSKLNEKQMGTIDGGGGSKRTEKSCMLVGPTCAGGICDITIVIKTEK